MDLLSIVVAAVQGGAGLYDYSYRHESFMVKWEWFGDGIAGLGNRSELYAEISPAFPPTVLVNVTKKES